MPVKREDNLEKEKLLAEIALWYNWIKTHG